MWVNAGDFGLLCSMRKWKLALDSTYKHISCKRYEPKLVTLQVPENPENSDNKMKILKKEKQNGFNSGKVGQMVNSDTHSI